MGSVAGMCRCVKSACFRTLAHWLLLALPGLLLVTIGAWGWMEAHGHGHCEMSFMAPVYTELKMARPSVAQAATNASIPFVSRFAGRYKLFRYTDAFGREADYLGGYPVIFVPGNRGRYWAHLLYFVSLSCNIMKWRCCTGSHQQARSIGSALGHMSGKLRVSDVFAVSFEEDAAALFGDLIWDQAVFLNDVIASVRSLYDREFGKGVLLSLVLHCCHGCAVIAAPAAESKVNVTLIAHSVGGITSRAVFLLRQYVPGSVANVITLGTSHQW